MKILIHTNKLTYPFDLYSISTPVYVNDSMSKYNIKPEYEIDLQLEKTDVNNSLIFSFLNDHNIFKNSYTCEIIIENRENIIVKDCKLEFNNFYMLNNYYDILIRTPQKVQLESIKKIRFKKLKEIFNKLT